MADRVLNSKQEAYLEWLCTAPSERQPVSKRKFAEAFSVAPQTLRNWEKNAAFREEWRSRVDEVQGSPEKTHSLLESLFARAMDGDMKAADLYLRATNRMVPQPIRVETEHRVAELSDEELDALIGVAAVRERDARVEGGNASGFIDGGL